MRVSKIDQMNASIWKTNPLLFLYIAVDRFLKSPFSLDWFWKHALILDRFFIGGVELKVLNTWIYPEVVFKLALIDGFRKIAAAVFRKNKPFTINRLSPWITINQVLRWDSAYLSRSLVPKRCLKRNHYLSSPHPFPFSKSVSFSSGHLFPSDHLSQALPHDRPSCACKRFVFGHGPLRCQLSSSTILRRPPIVAMSLCQKTFFVGARLTVRRVPLNDQRFTANVPLPLLSLTSGRYAMPLCYAKDSFL